MDVNIIASIYMAEDDMPCLIVTCKKYNELVNNPQPIVPIFYGMGNTAKESHANIFKAFGLSPKDDESQK